jgi:hypothetical protein
VFKRLAIAAALFGILAGVPALGIADGLVGLMIFAHDGTFLGEVSCTDVGNPYSRHGSKFSSVSIWKKFSSCGSEFPSLSSYNRFTSTPPVLVNEAGDIVGHLSETDLFKRQ